jgi:hypothetical protein
MAIRKYRLICKHGVTIAFAFIGFLVFRNNCLAQNLPKQKLIGDTLMYYASPYARKGLILASYPGGIPAFIKFIDSHMQLPDSVKVTGEDPGGRFIDKVLANFEVEKDGRVSGVELLHSLNNWPGIKGKIHNVLTAAIKMSVWKPATVNNEPIKGGCFIFYIWFVKK